MSLALAGCAADDTFEVPEGFFGAVVVEEPRAALLARDVLVAGGTAADAATTVFFTLAVTLPSSAGLGAFGSCLVFEPQRASLERLTFYPRAVGSGAAATLPVGPRAMFALHARYGRLPFEGLLIQAERLARFGEPVSRVLADDLAGHGAALGSDPAAARVFAPEGRLLTGGDAIVQLDLAATLGRLRGEGVGLLFSGALANAFASAAGEAGFPVEPERLRAALPVWEAVSGTVHDNHFWGVSGATPGDTALIGTALALVLDGADWTDGNDAQRRHLLAEALTRAAPAAATGQPVPGEDAAEQAMQGYDAGRRSQSAATGGLASALGTNATPTPGATGFMIVDSSGQAVTCAIGLGRPFGTGRMASGLGVLIAALPGDQPDGPGAGALLVANTNTKRTQMAASSSGGRPALSALLQTTLDHWELNRRFETVMATPRTHYAGGSDTLYVEPSLDPAGRQALGGFGYRLAEAGSLGVAGAFRCENGIPYRPLTCDLASDPRSRGLAIFDTGG